jgi:exonuclease SbcC
MRLVALRLENFRSYEHCELDLNSDGLIGVNGPNGAGKSTLLDAIHYALYGLGKGRGRKRPERDGMKEGERCEVELEFILDERHFLVRRGMKPNRAKMEIDGEVVVSSGQEELTSQVTEQLGIGQTNFTMTFYARQREIEAFAPGDPRGTEQLEALLGIDRVRSAVEAAKESAKEQDAAVRGLESTLVSTNEAKAKLEKAEEEAAKHGPEIEKGEEEAEAALEAKKTSWKALGDARSRAEEAFALDAKAQVARGELKSAEERAKETGEVLKVARVAAVELAENEPAAARVEELMATDRALDLEKKAHEQAEALRERRREAESRAIATADELRETADPGPKVELAEAKLVEQRTALERVNSDLIEVSQLREASRRGLEEGKAALQAAERRAELMAELKQLTPAREAAAVQMSETAALGAERAQLDERVAEEEEHFSHVQSDGAKATCPRCRRPYEGDFKLIIAEFEKALRGLKDRKTEIGNRLGQLTEELESAEPRLKRLQAVEGELNALDEADGEVEALQDAVEERRGAVEKLSERDREMRVEKDALSEEIKVREEQLAELRAALTARRTLEATRASAEKDRDLFDEQLGELSSVAYDPVVHEEVKVELAKASSAKESCDRLRGQAEQVELLAARLSHEEEMVVECKRSHKEAVSAATKRVGDKTAQEKAEADYEAKDKAHSEVEEALGELRRKAVLEDNTVLKAKVELEQAKRQKAKIEEEKREWSVRRMVVATLNSYRAAMQRDAVPSLEQETADLLRQVTRGRYSDVEITEKAELLLFDQGEHHGLARFSGGEQDIANLCMRIALSKMLARRSGAEANFIVLDEVFGSQDSDRRVALIEALRELDGEFGQVLVVSHVKDFMEHCALRINVETEDGKSTASIAS